MPALLIAARAGVRQPTGPFFDVVLLLHVACVVLGLGTLVVSATQAGRLRGLPAGAEVPPSLAGYYGPGTNWAGRISYGIPVFGFVLLGLSHGAFGLQTGWVDAGLAIWVIAIMVAEGLLWPAEHRIGGLLAAGERPAPHPEAATGAAVAQGARVAAPAGLRREATLAALVAWGVAALFLLAIVLMVAQP